MTSDDDEASATNASDADAFLRVLARAEPRPPPVGGTPNAARGENGVAPRALFGALLDGKYRIDGLLGQGGMGTVYSATHVGTGREVALKVLASGLTANDAAVERFQREARTTGQMRHPNVVDVTDFGFAERGGERLAYLVMERLRGKTLRAVLEAEARLPLDVAVDVLDQVCAAVDEAHRLGILHRDLKPENIHLEPAARGRYRVKVLDFGIAKLVDAVSREPAASAIQGSVAGDVALAATLPGEAAGTDATAPALAGEGSLTRLGAAIGTPRYMSPEQWRGQAVDARTDVYSLGVVAYEMLAGVPPFVGDGGPIAAEHREVAPPPLATKAPSVPRRVASVVEAALAKDPDARPLSAAAFAAGLSAGTETTGSLLRRSIALGVDHYAILSRRCASLTLGPFALAVVGETGAGLRHLGVLSARAEHALAIVTGGGAYVVMVLLYAPIGGLLTPLVADFLAFGDSTSPPPSFSLLRRVLRDSLVSTFVTYILMAIAGAIPLLPVAALAMLTLPKDLVTLVVMPAYGVLYAATVARFAVSASVVAVEHMSGLSPLKRSMKLLGSMRRPAFGVLLFYTLLGQMLPQLVLLAARDLASRASPGMAAAFGEVEMEWFVLYLFIGAITPFLLVPPAMLYLRAREAEGVPFRPEPPSPR